MRTITIEKTLLKFDELSDEQKNKVIDNHRDINTDGGYWHESVYEDWTTILEILGFSDIKIYYSGFSSQGDGACFEAKFFPVKNAQEKNDRIKKLKDYAPLENIYEIVERVLKYGFIDEDEDYTSRLSIYHRGFYYNDAYMTTDNANDDFLEACRDIARKIYRALEENYDYLNSDEAVKETLISNDYEFDSQTLKIS